jgi:hypothetical protein
MTMTSESSKSEKSARGNVLRIRLTSKERALLDQAAASKTLETSTWARSELVALAKKQLEKI